MANYNFSTLNDKDLEELVRDLFNKEFNCLFQSFKVGKDTGIDLRFSTINNKNEIIVQVKHYIKTSFAQLLYKLKKEEYEKILYLAPRRYIFVTSLPLSPQEKEKIQETLAPFILSTNDIFGYDDLNGLANKYKDIVELHYKLWFSNSQTLQRIVNNGIISRSEFIESKIVKIIGAYVRTKSSQKAFDVLEKEKFILITGEPGVGKTWLSYFIIYKYLANEYRLVFLDEKLLEGDDVISPDPDVKQIFFLDDFLGTYHLEIINPKNKESSIINFIERIKINPNKYLILTTRTTILHQANQYQEKLKRANLKADQYEVKLNAYNELDKAKILYNHLFFNEIPEEYLLKIFENKNYWTIINHRNYNPRLIEFITTSSHYLSVRPDNYLDFIIKTLNNPEEVWRYAFEEQLNDEERFLLITLLSFGRSAEFEDFEVAYEAKILYEIRTNHYQRKNNVFDISIRTLLDGYIKKIIQTGLGRRNWVEFINPSLGDFLIYYLSNSSAEKWRALEAFIYFEQYQHVFRFENHGKNGIEIKTREIPRLLKIINNKDLLSTSKHINQNHIFLKYVYLNLFFIEPEVSDYYAVQWLSRINWNDFQGDIYADLVFVLIMAVGLKETNKYIAEHWDVLICILFLNANSEDELSRIKTIFDLYNVEYEGFTYEDKHIQIVSGSIDKIFNSIEKYILTDRKKSVTNQEDADEIIDEIVEKYNQLYHDYLSASTNYIPDPFYGIDIDDLIVDNLKRMGKEESLQDDWKDNYHEVTDIRGEIDNLFC